MTWLGGSKGSLVDLTDEECWTRLRLHRIARLAWCGPDGPRMVVLNYVVHESRPWFRCAPYSELAREVRDRPVLLEVDDLDDVRHTGTSVLLRGTARFADPYDGGPEVVPWPAGQRSLLVAVEVAGVTGRRLLPAS